jgi:hypothetical protein
MTPEQQAVVQRFNEEEAYAERLKSAFRLGDESSMPDDLRGMLDSEIVNELEALRERAKRAEAALEGALKLGAMTAMQFTQQLEVNLELSADRATIAERVRALEAAMPDPSKLWALAEWIDVKYPNDDNPEVQDDLRRWTREIMALGLHGGITAKDVLEGTLTAPAPVAEGSDSAAVAPGSGEEA